MAERSGFFPYVEGDTNSEYDDTFLAKWVHSFIGNGIYNGDLALTAGTNMQVILPTGQAWINGYYYKNDSNLSLTIANADGILKRKDTVVLRWDINTRNITAKVLTGTFASTPIAPAIVRTAEQYDLKLAEIYIGAGATAISQANITDTRLDNTVCGIVTQLVQTVNTTTLYNQIQSDLATFKSTNETGFNTWLESIKGILDADTAGNLLNLITNKVIFSNTQPTGQGAGDIWYQTNSTDDSFKIMKSLGNNSYTQKYPSSNASFISTTDGSNVQAKLDLDNKINTYTCTTTGTVHKLVGTGSNGKFLADANFVGGDTFTVGTTSGNVTAKTATTQNGASLDDSYFVSGKWVNFTYDGTNLNFKSGGGTAVEIFNFKLFIQPESTPPTAEKAGDLWVHHALATDFNNIVLDDAVKVSYANGSLMLIVDDTNNGSDNITQTKKVNGSSIPFTSHRDSANDTTLPWQAGLLNKSGNIIDIKRKYPIVYSRLSDVLDLETAYVWDGTQWVLVSQQGSYLAVGTVSTPYYNLYNRAGSTLNPHSAIPSFPSARVNVVKNSLNGIDSFYGLNASPWLINVQRSGDSPALVALTIHTADIVNDISISKSGVYAVVVHTHAVDVYKKTSGTWSYLSTILSDATNTFYGCDWRPDDSEIAVTKSVTPFALRMKRTNDAFVQLANPTTMPIAACYKCKYSPDGQFLAVRTSDNSPYIWCYHIVSDTQWDKIADPTTGCTGYDVFYNIVFTSNGYLVTVDRGANKILFFTYSTSGLVYVTAFSITGAQCIAITLDGLKLAAGLISSPYFAWYSLNGTSLTPLSNPTTMPTNAVLALDFLN